MQARSESTTFVEAFARAASHLSERHPELHSWQRLFHEACPSSTRHLGLPHPELPKHHAEMRPPVASDVAAELSGRCHCVRASCSAEQVYADKSAQPVVRAVHDLAHRDLQRYHTTHARAAPSSEANAPSE